VRAQAAPDAGDRNNSSHASIRVNFVREENRDNFKDKKKFFAFKPLANLWQTVLKATVMRWHVP
jgi:hypothetical protein